MVNELPQRHTFRLQGYDYASEGIYFVTLCTQNKWCLFGDVISGEMILNEVGRAVNQCWLDIPVHYPHVVLDEYIVMPNHVHGILEIAEPVGANNFRPNMIICLNLHLKR
jgi:REP element-mobilizing transposase RayT